MSREFANSNRLYLTVSCRSFLGLLTVLFCLFAGISSARAATVCDFHMMKKLEAKTRFVDAKEVAKSSAQQLQADSKMYVDVREQLQAHLKTDLSIEDINLTQSMIRNVSQYIELLQRLVEQKRTGKAPTPDVAPTVHFSVGTKTARQLFPEMAEIALAHTSNPVVRYFPIARQDIARVTGTDRTGMQPGESWDEWGLEATLNQNGLNIDDGLYALPLDDMRSCGVDKDGPDCPYEMIDEFIRGERGFAVYDGDQLTTDGPDFYLFANPLEKAKALKAIILPAH